MLVSSCWRRRAIRLSRSSSFTRRLRRRSSEKALRRNSPSVRGRLMREPPNSFLNYTREEAGAVLRLGPQDKNLQHRGHRGSQVTLSRPTLVDVTVAAGFFAGGGGAAEVGNDSFKIADQQRNTFPFGAQGKKLLFEIQIKRQRTSEVERKQRRVGGGDILFCTRDGEQFRVQLNRARSVRLERSARFVVDHEDFSLEERTFLIDPYDLETPAAFGNDVEAAVGIFFDDGNDFGRASDLGETLFDSAHHTEGTMLREALTDHFFIARLEDVQWQGSAGEQDDIER